MGFFPTLFNRRSARPGPTDDYWYMPFGGSTKAGVQVTESNALKYLAVLTCVTLVAGDIMRLPFSVMQKNKDGSRARVYEHPLDDLLHNAPNPETASSSWRESKQSHLMLWGNTYDYISKDKPGRTRQLWQFDEPHKMKVRRLSEDVVLMGPDGEKRKHKAKDLVYEYEKVTYRHSEIFHIPGFGFNGITGISMIGLAREAVARGLASEEFQSKFFGEGTHPSVVVSLPPEAQLGEDEEKYKEALKKSIAGLKNAHGIAVFGNGEKVDRLTMNLDDAQYLETQIDNRAQVAAIYHVPLHMLNISGSNTNYNNTEQEVRAYVNRCLSHWTIRWEQLGNLRLLTPEDRRKRLYCKMDLKGLLVGDIKDRTEFNKTLFNSGYPLNKILEREDMNPVPGGDQGYIQLNMVPVDQVGKIQQQKVTPKKEKKSIRSATENRSIQIRDRITKRYYPLIENIAEKLVSREAEAVKAQVAKYRSQRDVVDDLSDWLEDFYSGFSQEVKDEIGPVFRSFSEAIMDAAKDEIGQEEDVDIDKFVSDYVDRYAERHTESSQGQLIALLRGEIEDLEIRVDEWRDSRPEKIAVNESNRLSNGIFTFVAWGAGLQTVLRNRGPKTCPFCRSLEGTVSSPTKPIVSDGDEVEPKGTDDPPMKIRGTKYHVPIHRNCDCFMSII